MSTPNAIRSEIGFAVWMAVEGWRKQGGRGMWRRTVKRLVSEPTVYECMSIKSPSDEGAKSDMCPDCGTKHGCLCE